MQIKKDFSYKVIVIIAIVGLIFGLSGCTLQQKSDGETDDLFGQAIKPLTEKLLTEKKSSEQESISKSGIQSKEERSRRKKKECDVNEAVQMIMDMVINNANDKTIMKAIDGMGCEKLIEGVSVSEFEITSSTIP